MQNSIQSKRFVIRKSLIGQNTIIEVTFKNGKTFKYNHDKAYELMSSNLEHFIMLVKVQLVHFFHFSSKSTSKY
jgi:hypothetical protein